MLALSDRVRGLSADWHARTGRLAAATQAPLIKTAVAQALHRPVTAVSCRQAAPTTRAGRRTRRAYALTYRPPSSIAHRQRRRRSRP